MDIDTNTKVEKNKPIIIFVGMPGAGKSTQARLLSLACGFTRISAGDQLRELVKQGESSIQKEVESLMSRGALMPDELLISVVIAPIQTAYRVSRGFVLDGVPRSLTQANMLAVSLKELGVNTVKAVHLYISPEQALT